MKTKHKFTQYMLLDDHESLPLDTSGSQGPVLLCQGSRGYFASSSTHFQWCNFCFLVPRGQSRRQREWCYDFPAQTKPQDSLFLFVDPAPGDFIKIKQGQVKYLAVQNTRPCPIKIPAVLQLVHLKKPRCQCYRWQMYAAVYMYKLTRFRLITLPKIVLT